MNEETRAHRGWIQTIQDKGGTWLTVGRSTIVEHLEAAENAGFCKAHRSSIGEVDCKATWTLTEAGNALLKQKEVFVRRTQATGTINHGWSIMLTSSDTAGDEARAYAILDAIVVRVQAAHPHAIVWRLDGVVSNTWELRAVQPPEALATFPNGPIHRKAIAALIRTVKAEYEAIVWVRDVGLGPPKG